MTLHFLLTQKARFNRWWSLRSLRPYHNPKEDSDYVPRNCNPTRHQCQIPPASTTREYQLPESLHLHEQEGLLQIVYSDASPWHTIPVEFTQTLCLLCIPTPQLVLQSPQLAQSLQSPIIIELNSKPEKKRYSQNMWQKSGAFRIFMSKLLILKQTLVVRDISVSKQLNMYWRISSSFLTKDCMTTCQKTVIL